MTIPLHGTETLEEHGGEKSGERRTEKGGTAAAAEARVGPVAQGQSPAPCGPRVLLTGTCRGPGMVLGCSKDGNGRGLLLGGGGNLPQELLS